MSREQKYHHVIQAVFGAPWAIMPRTLATIVEVVRFRAEGGRMTDEEIRERLDAAQSGPRRGRQDGLVAVLPLYGVISPRQTLMSQTSGGTSLDSLTKAFRSVMADPAITAVVFDVDSPGGTVDGVDEFAQEVRAARGQKPMVAVANTLMASAAYWALAGVDEIVASPSASIGSIGVIAAHSDVSEQMALEGIKTTLVTSSKYKSEGNPFEPLSDEARAELQKQVSYFGTMFEQTVARGRGVSLKKVQADFGQGRVLNTDDARRVGLIDRVETLDATVRRLARGGTVQIGSQPQTPEIEFDGMAGGVAGGVRISGLRLNGESDNVVVETVTTTEITETTEIDDGEPHAGLPFADHAERVRLDVTALARRAGEIRALRAEDGRALSDAKREQLSAIAADLLEAHGSIQALLEPGEPEIESAPSDAAAARRRRLALAEATYAPVG